MNIVTGYYVVKLTAMYGEDYVHYMIGPFQTPEAAAAWVPKVEAEYCNTVSTFKHRIDVAAYTGTHLPLGIKNNALNFSPFGANSSGKPPLIKDILR